MMTQAEAKAGAKVYGLGMGKTGTHTIAELFSPVMRTAHEPGAREMIGHLRSMWPPDTCNEASRRFIVERDQALKLDLESSQILVFYLPLLLDLFQQARFILTVRHPLSWLDSFINHQLSRPASGEWLEFRSLRFARGPWMHSSHTAALERRGLFTLDGYLAYWTWHNQRVIDLVPDDRLLVVDTGNLSHETRRLADHVGINRERLADTGVHAYRSIESFDVVAQLDPIYVREKLLDHCAASMATLSARYGIAYGVESAAQLSAHT